MRKLFIVATPIGNLSDITLRALETLKSVEVILAEDTRVTRKLLGHYGIKKQVLRYLPQKKHDRFRSIALVTDAGTPSISDPGLKLVRDLCQRGFNAVPIPGPSALSAMLSVSDIEVSKFCFLGFPPHKKGRQRFFGRIAENRLPTFIFESPHRIQRTLKELEIACGDRYINVGRELTKIYEEIFRGKLSEAIKYFTGEKQRGEFVIIISCTDST